MVHAKRPIIVLEAKDPNAILPYTIDWSRWLGGATIESSEWEADDGITVVSTSNTDTQTEVWLSGGIDGSSYQVTNHIVVSDGREDDRTLLIRVEER